MNREKEIVEAVKAGDVITVQKLSQDQLNLAAVQSEDGVSVILLAQYYGHREIVETLHNTGVVLNIFEAAATGKIERLDELIRENPVLTKEYSNDGFTALGLAAFFGNAEIVELLLIRRADVNAVSKNDMRVRPLHSAVANRNTVVAYTIAEILLKNGAEINVQQNGGWTPLHQAAMQGLDDLVKLLLSYGAEPYAPNDEGTTAVQMALDKGHQETAALIVKHARR